MFDFCVTVESNYEKIIGRITGSIPEGADFYFYILRYGKVIFRSGWCLNPLIEYTAEVSGTYTIQGHVRYAGDNVHKISFPVFVFLEHDRKDFADFLELPNKEVLPELRFFEAPNPFVDFLISIREGTEQGADFVNSLKSNAVYEIGNWCATLYSSITPQNIGNQTEVLFSGVAKLDKEDCLLVGQDEVISNISSIEGLRNAVGTFNLLIYNHKDNLIEISSDYFGVCKLYYYQDVTRVLVSNRLHLLLHGIADQKIAVKIDWDELMSTLAFGNLQPFHQSFSSGVSFTGIKLLPVDKKIMVSTKGFKLVHAPIAKDILICLPEKKKVHSNDLGTVIDSYEEMLPFALSEIVQNTKAALTHKQYQKIVVDLSGGMDSRLVFAAITNISGCNEKVLISTRESKAEPNDHIVACTIQSLYSGYRFDDLPVTIEENGLENPWSDNWSYYLGTYYSYIPSIMRQKYPEDVLRLVGFYGEIVARPYYSRKHRGTELDVQSVEEFVEKYFERYGALSVMASERCLTLAKRLFLNELIELPGRTALEKFELHYLFFRNGLHCSPVLRTAYSCLEWGPLQSKTLFKMKYIFSHMGSKLQLDAINELNPIIARVPYQSDADEKERIEYFKNRSDFESRQFLATLKIQISKDLAEWDSSVNKRKKAQVRNLSREFSGYARQSQECLITVTLSALKIVLQNFEPLSREVGAQLWFFINSHKSDSVMCPQVANIANRIMSIYYQSLILGKLKDIS